MKMEHAIPSETIEKKIKGKNKESLANSKNNKANFFFRMGIKTVPNSILIYDRSDSSIDLSVNERSGKDFNRDLINRTCSDRQLRDAFGMSGPTCRRKDGALSKFPQNIGKILVKFFCPQNGIVYDPFAGHNSRMQLTYESNRSYIGIDISHEFMTKNHEIRDILKSEKRKGLLIQNQNFIRLIECSSSKIEILKNDFADFTITSPPYWCVEWYGDEPEQLGNAKTYTKFIELISEHVKENFRILKPGSYCAWFINDFIMDKIFYPYHIDIARLFQESGFILHNIYIVDLGRPFTESFIQSIINTKCFPKRHEFCIIGKKPGVNQNVEDHILSLIK